MSKGKNKKRTVIYALIGISVVTIATLITLKLIYNLWFPPFFDIKTGKIPAEINQMKDLGRDLQKDNKTIIYRNIRNYQSANRFHKIATEIRIDNVDSCVTCHGNVPHYKNEDRRAFLNKHSLYLSCETCHISKTEINKFVWYDVKTGELILNHKVNIPILDSDIKVGIIDKNLTAYNNIDKINSAKQLLKNAKQMSRSEREKALKEVHKNNLEKNYITCENCHTDKNRFLPFEELGYTDERIKQIVTTDVVQMVLKYKEFYLPTIISGNEEGD